MNLKATRTVVVICLGLNLLWCRVLFSAEPLPAGGPLAQVRLTSLKGKIRIAGTSNLDDWQVEGRSIEGFMNVSSNFPGEFPESSTPRRAEAWLEVKSLHSIEKDGKPFSNKMDEIMYEALRQMENPRITFRLSDLEPRGVARHNGARVEFTARGRLTVAGVTNEVSMPISVESLGSHQIKITGATGLKMTDFRIEPPSPKIALGLIRTGDEVKLSFEWVLLRH